MEKINWINGQSGGTPLSAENLNLMQDNAENAIDEVATTLEQLKTDVENKHTYSTEEQVIGTWIDGKPLYRKTLVYNGAVTGTNYIDLTSLNYEFIVIKETSLIRSNFIFSPVRYNMQSANDLAEVFIDNTQKKMNINIGSPWNNINCYVTIQYTKTTD